METEGPRDVMLYMVWGREKMREGLDIDSIKWERERGATGFRAGGGESQKGKKKKIYKK